MKQRLDAPSASRAARLGVLVLGGFRGRRVEKEGVGDWGRRGQWSYFTLNAAASAVGII